VLVNNAMLKMKETNRAEREEVIITYFGESILTGTSVKRATSNSGDSSSGSSSNGLNYWVISPPFALILIYAITVLARDVRRARKTLSAISVADGPAMMDVVKQIIQTNRTIKEEEEKQKENNSFSVKSLSKLNDKFEKRFHKLDRKLDVLLEALGKADVIKDIHDSPPPSPFLTPKTPARKAPSRTQSLSKMDSFSSDTTRTVSIDSLKSFTSLRLSIPEKHKLDQTVSVVEMNEDNEAGDDAR
jgi:hypothetical protein